MWQARGYARWTTDDVTPVEQAFDGVSGRSMADIVKKAKEQPGWIIPRCAPPRMIHLPTIFPEYRPDHPVRTGRRKKHFHAEAGIPVPPPPWDCPRGSHRKGDPNYAGTYMDCGSCVLPQRVFSSAAMDKHIKKSKGKSRTKAKSPTDHRGKNSDQVHVHDPFGKYQHASNPRVLKVKRHDHEEYNEYKRLATLKKHVQFTHKGADVAGIHEHWDRVKDHENGHASRLDVHPIAAKMLAEAEVVFFGIEGCLNADAMLTYILNYGLMASVVSVPAIGNWNAPELRDFVAIHLIGKKVYIVADADAYKNESVMEQARLLQTRLRWLGVADVHIALPPARTRRKYKGVDDFLAAGGWLEDLEVIDRDSSPALGAFIQLHQRRGDQGRRLSDVLYALSMHAGPDGSITASLRSQARVVGTNVERFRRGLHDLVQVSAVTVIGDLKTRRDAYVNRYYSLDFIEDWEGDRPTILIAPELRAIDLPKRNLGPIPKCDIGEQATLSSRTG